VYDVFRISVRAFASMVTRLYSMSLFVFICIGELMSWVRLYPISAYVFLYACVCSYTSTLMCLFMFAYICFWCFGVCIGTLFSCVL